MFVSEEILRRISWQAFERLVCRMLVCEDYEDIRLVGQSHDEGADVVAHKFGKRWLFQVKRWRSPVGIDVVDRTVRAAQVYRAQIPVIVSLGGFQDSVREHQQVLISRQIQLQLWDQRELFRRVSMLRRVPPIEGKLKLRRYQDETVQLVAKTFLEGAVSKAMVVMATGLGKTVVAAESLRRILASRKVRTLVLAHTNELVYQLERAFWPFLAADQDTLVLNGLERPTRDRLDRADLVFACVDSVFYQLSMEGGFPEYDLLVIDECHHAGAAMYSRIILETRAGTATGPFLLGLTATPWRSDVHELDKVFGEPLVTVDMLTGLRNGFLAQLDYRIYIDNIKWEALRKLKGGEFSPKYINKTLFISEWDEGVIREFTQVWETIKNPRAIVFCGTIDHAVTMRDRLNALGICNAAAVYSGIKGGRSMSAVERNRALSDFHDGTIQAICAVDIFNEGVDVPDVNLIVFQRVTHSRRIFVQQLGRGLRIAPEKSKVVVLDFVSDIRRFAAGLELKDGLVKDPSIGPTRIRLNHQVTFRRVGGENTGTEVFLRQWLEDVAAIEAADEDASVLKFPPPFGERIP